VVRINLLPVLPSALPFKLRVSSTTSKPSLSTAASGPGFSRLRPTETTLIGNRSRIALLVSIGTQFHASATALLLHRGSSDDNARHSRRLLAPSAERPGAELRAALKVTLTSTARFDPPGSIQPVAFAGLAPDYGVPCPGRFVSEHGEPCGLPRVTGSSAGNREKARVRGVN